LKNCLSIFLALSCLLTQAPPARAQSAAKTAVPSTQTAIDWSKERAAAPKGKVEAFEVQDNQYRRKRKVWVYTPPGYHAQAAEPCRLLLSFDGEDYLKEIPAPTILDNLLAAGKIHPTIQVMIDNSEDRLGDLANHQKFADFLVRDLLPWAQKKFRVAREANKTALCGYSAGGLAAAYVAFNYPNQFGNVLSQSGAFWRGNEGGTEQPEWLTAQYKSSPKLDVRFYLEVGAGETGRTAGGVVFIEANQRLRDVLRAKGYDVKYLEAPNAIHNAEHWRAQLADGIIYLMGKA